MAKNLWHTKDLGTVLTIY